MKLLVLMRIMLFNGFNLKVKLTGQTGNNGTKNVKIMVPFKHLTNFWRILSLDLNWSENCVIVANNANQVTIFSMTHTKLYVLVVTLSTQYLVLKEQLTEINIDQKYQRKDKINIYIS